MRKWQGLQSLKPGVLPVLALLLCCADEHLGDFYTKGGAGFLQHPIKSLSRANSPPIPMEGLRPVLQAKRL